MDRTRIKICGLFRPQDIGYANRARPDYAGFILSPGFRRSIDGAQAAKFRGALDAGIPAVGVFVDAPCQEILFYLNEGIIQMAQLHGSEKEEDIRFIKACSGKPMLKAVKVKNRADVEAWLDSEADYLLFDAGTGTGKTFDWSLLSDVARPYFLAGGLNAENLTQALALQPYAVDLSSGVETDGIKDLEKMRTVVRLARERGGSKPSQGQIPTK